jgi:hypothetical protein
MQWLKQLRQRLFASAELARLSQELRASRDEVRQLRARVQEQQQRLDAGKRRVRALKEHLIRRDSEPAKAKFERKPFAHPDAAALYALANVVSYPKCGRTWLAHLYCEYTRYHLDARDVPRRSLNMPERNPAFVRFLAAQARDHRYPICQFTHLGFSSFKPFEENGQEWPDKARTVLLRPTVLLVRDPRDVLVSHYHHLQERRAINSDTTLSAFIRGAWGVNRVVRFVNMWAPAIHERNPHLLVCTYETLRTDTARTLTAVLTFLGVTVKPAGVTQAVQESSFDRLRQKEHSRRRHQGAALDGQGFRFRQGAVGRHAKELSPADVAYLDAFLAAHLDPAFDRYRQRPSPASVLVARYVL